MFLPSLPSRFSSVRLVGKIPEVVAVRLGSDPCRPLAFAPAPVDPAVFGNPRTLRAILPVLNSAHDTKVLTAIVVPVTVFMVALARVSGLKAKDQAVHSYRGALAVLGRIAHRIALFFAPLPLIQPLEVGIVNEGHGLHGAISST